MSCPHRALLIITKPIEGTASEVAKERVELSCGLPEAHDGPHRDDDRGETWEDRGRPFTHVFRHDEPA